MTEPNAPVGSSERSSVSSAPTNEAHVDAFTRDRFVDMFLSQSRRAQMGLLVAASLTAFIWFGQTKSAAPPVWMACVVAVTALRFRFTDTIVRAQEGRRATARIALLLLINGLLMAAPLAAFHLLSDVERTAVSIILMATATASVATTSGYRFVFLAFAAPMLVPLAIAWGLESIGESTHWPMAGLALLILLYLLFLCSIGAQANKVFEDSSRFRYGEQEMNQALKVALDSASEANRAKTQFLAAASHDLRQPIHSMNVAVAALSLRQLDGPSREIVNLLDSVNQMLSAQLDGLLHISQLDAGIVRPSISTHRLDRIAFDQHAAMAIRAKEQGLTCRVGSLHEVSAQVDKALLSRVIGNLLDNALKFTPRGGVVTVSVAHEALDAVVCVSDTGIGIPADEHERVFHEFYQVGNVARDRSKGLGLGLSIVRRMCRLMGIALELHSQPKVGTTVTLRMPAVHAVAVAEMHSAPSPIPAGLSVLVVDDEQIVRDGMRLLLSGLGCTVHLADGTEQADAIARTSGIDVVLSDYRLREGDSGLQALKRVLHLQPLARAALVTGDTAPDRISDAQAAGVPLLHKPVSLEGLLKLLRPEPTPKTNEVRR